MTQKIKYIDLRWEDARYFCLKEPKEPKETEIDSKNKDEKIEEEKPLSEEEDLTQSQYIEIPDDN